jgi:hypothetical protein
LPSRKFDLALNAVCLIFMAALIAIGAAQPEAARAVYFLKLFGAYAFVVVFVYAVCHLSWRYFSKKFGAEAAEIHRPNLMKALTLGMGPASWYSK